MLLKEKVKLEEAYHRGFTLVHTEAVSRSLASLTLLIKAGASVNSITLRPRDNFEAALAEIICLTPLFLATTYDQPRCHKALIDAGARLEKPCNDIAPNMYDSRKKTNDLLCCSL